jgi:extracellular factor (EF) 3-hydroxypalmitic acid methyl ester biosynthesis protein
MTIERSPSVRPPPPPPITGVADGPVVSRGFEVLGAQRLSFDVSFPNEPAPEMGEIFTDVLLRVGGGLDVISLGRCRFESPAEAGVPPSSGPLGGPPSSVVRPGAMPSSVAHPEGPPSWAMRPGGCVGKLVPLDEPIDCRELLRCGGRVLVTDAFNQLPLLLARKEGILTEFQRYTADLVYDLRVYRSIFDEVDAGLAIESEATRAEVERIIVEGPGRQFMRFFDERVEALGELVRSFSRQDHERHGFYFRRQLWDVILSVPMLVRTNIRPRGYAGDYVMMEYIYRDELVGSSLFGKILHKNIMDVVASQAVRNRIRLLADTITAARRAWRAGPDSRLRVLSVACGPAFEVGNIFTTTEDCNAYEYVLLDQDEEALATAAGTLRGVEDRTRGTVHARFIRQSVRTMLRDRRFAEMIGRYHLVYSMGLFDYLTAPVARAVLSKLYDLVEPGGRMVVGNFHVANPSRWRMEYWGDWTLIHRTEEELLELAGDLPGATSSVSFEATGTQMFLSVWKAVR